MQPRRGHFKTVVGTSLCLVFLNVTGTWIKISLFADALLLLDDCGLLSSFLLAP